MTATTHSTDLSTLSRAEPDRLKAFADTLIPLLGEIEVIENRTGLIMLPMKDTAQGTHFHLGEVLVSEAKIAAGGEIGYGMRRGRDLEASMAMALVDLCLALGVAAEQCRDFIGVQATELEAADRDTLCRVEATRAEMETF